MVSITEGKHEHFFIDFAWEKDAHIRSYRLGLEEVFEGKYLDTLFVPLQGQAFLLVGCGKENPGCCGFEMQGNENKGMFRGYIPVCGSAG